METVAVSYRTSRVLQGRRLPRSAYVRSLYFRLRIVALASSEQRELIEGTDRFAHAKYSVTDIDELMKILETVDRRGYAIINEELEIGLHSLATPVRDQNGSVVAPMNIGLRAPLVGETEMLRTMLPALSAAASELSSRIIL